MLIWPALEIAIPLSIACGIAFTSEAALGFGATLIMVAAGSFFVDLELLLPALVPVNLLLSSWIALRHRALIDWRFLLRRLLPTMALGIPLGLYAFAALDASLLKRIFGLFLVVVSVLELRRMRRSDEASELDRWWERAFLVAGGALHGAFATGGPMAVYVTSRAIDDKGVYRATLSTLWLLLNVVVVGGYAFQGALGAQTVGLSAWFVPAVLFGVALGEYLHARVPERTFRLLVYGLLTIAGLALVVRG